MASSTARIRELPQSTECITADCVTGEFDGECTVQSETHGELRATIAAHVGALAVGDPVLIIRVARGAWFVIGAMGEARRRDAHTSDGVSARVADDRLEVRDREGALLFEHRAGENKTVLCVPHGNLELRAAEGSIDLVARNSVRVRGEREVQIESGNAVELRASAPGESGTAVRLERATARIASPLIEAIATRAEATWGDARIVARTLTTTVDTLKQAIGVLETRAERIVERARNAYRDVEELAQTRAGRMKLVAEDTLHVLGGRTLFKARRDMKLKSEKIYIG